MSFIDNYRRRRLATSGPESIATLDHMEGYFRNGANWTQGMYENANGARCLVGAANHVSVSSLDAAKHWLRQAIAEVAPEARRIEDFNDTRRTYAEVAAVIARAKQLALAAQAPVAALPASAPRIDILPPERALPAPVFVNRTPPRPTRVRRSLVDWIMD